MRGMILSVVIPCYNMATYLDKCLSSLCDPCLEGRLEALIVNDGSTDESRGIALGYTARMPGLFRLIDKENGGHGSAVNAGIDAARGKYLRIVDADDWVTGLPPLLDALEDADADLVIDQKFEVEKETGRETFFALPESVPFGVTLPFSDWCGDTMTEYYMLHTMNVRLDFLKKLNVRLLEHTFYVDFEYVLKTTSRARTVRFVNLGVYHYLVGNREQSVAPVNYVKRADQHRRVTEECLRFRQTADMQMRRYARRRCQLLVHTHLNILLIYDRDRSHGRRAARDFMRWLKAHDSEIWALVRRRYALALALHCLGFTDETLAWLKRLTERKRARV